LLLNSKQDQNTRNSLVESITNQLKREEREIAKKRLIFCFLLSKQTKKYPN